MNKITILDDSIQLILFYGEEKQILKTFGKKQITYLIENNNLKVFAANDYFYRGCLWSSDIPLLINDEVYSDIPSIVEKLDEWFYSPNEGGGSGTTITVDASLSTTSTNPVQNKVITSAISGFVTSDFVDGEIEEATSGLASTEWVEQQNYLTEHQPLKTINGEAISGTGDIVITSQTVDAYTKAETDALLADKQDELSAGTGIDITDNVISVTLDTDLFIIVQELPQTGLENKFYLVPTSASGTNNVYAEYIYENGAWEKMGEVQAEVDLSNYLTKSEASSTYATKQEIPTVPTNVSAFNNDAGYLTSHQPLKTLNGESLSGTGNIVVPVFQLRWTGDGDNYICDNVTHTKYQQEMQQVSFDNGGYWMSIGNTRRGSVIEYDSEDCGYIAPQYRWVEKAGATACTGTSKCKVEKEQVSYDSGVTFVDVVPEVTRNGEVIEVESSDCGFDPDNYKAKFIMGNGDVYYINKSHYDTGELTSAYTCEYSAAVEVVVYSTVSQIGDGCFRAFGNMSAVTIPNTVTRVGASAFAQCTSLSSVTIPSSVTRILDSAFENCHNLTSITSYASTAPVVSAYTFAYIHQNGTLYTPNGGDYSSWMSNGAYYLGYYGWTVHKTNRWVDDGDNYICSGSSGYDKYQRQKQQVSYNDGTTWEDVNPAVYQCGSLIEANSIDCGADPSLTKKAKLILNNETIVYVPKNESTELTNEEIAPYYDNTVSVIVYSGVTGIGMDTFYDCYSLTSVTIPDSVTEIGDSAFSSCHSLSSITIPDSVTTIGASAFAQCTSLSSVTIPSGVTSIGGSAFYSCYGLLSVTIPDSVTSIGNETFQNCTSLTSVTIGSGVTSIGQNAFSYCESLTNITIPSGVTVIAFEAFRSCSGLTSITSYATTAPTITNYTFRDIASTGVLTIPQGSDYSTWIAKLPSGWTVQYI